MNFPQFFSLIFCAITFKNPSYVLNRKLKIVKKKGYENGNYLNHKTILNLCFSQEKF